MQHFIPNRYKRNIKSTTNHEQGYDEAINVEKIIRNCRVLERVSYRLVITVKSTTGWSDGSKANQESDTTFKQEIGHNKLKLSAEF